MYHLYFLFINFEVLCAKNLNFSKKIAHLNFAVENESEARPPPYSSSSCATFLHRVTHKGRDFQYNQKLFKVLKLNWYVKFRTVVFDFSSFVGNPV